MERFGRGPTLAALLAMLALTCAVAHAESEDPPPRSGRLGLAIASLDDNWRETNAYRAAGLMVVGVDPRGRAAKSGIVAGDVLVSVGSHTMREPSDLGHAERTLSPDRAVSIVLAREGGRLIKVFEIAPVGAAPIPAAAAPPTTAPSTEPAPLAAIATSDTAADAASPGLVAATTATPDTSSPSAALATSAPASESSLSPSAVATSSAAADTTARPAATGASVVGTDQAAGLKAGSDSAPSVTANGAAAVPSAAGGSTSAPVSLAGPAAVAVVPVAAAAGGSEAPPATTTAAADSGGNTAESAESDAAVLGVVGRSLTPDLATALGAAGVEGVLVLDLDAASPADRSGIRAGDIIVKVGSQPVADMGEFQRAAAASASPVQVSTLRLGKPQVVLVALDGPPPVPVAPPTQEQLLAELRDEVRSLRREVQSLRKKLGK